MFEAASVRAAVRLCDLQWSGTLCVQHCATSQPSVGGYDTARGHAAAALSVGNVCVSSRFSTWLVALNLFSFSHAACRKQLALIDMCSLMCRIGTIGRRSFCGAVGRVGRGRVIPVPATAGTGGAAGDC
jgi:hypothetical protein